MTRIVQAFLILAAIVAGILPVSGPTVERAFSTSVYPAIQHAVTPVSNLVPFALFDLLTVAGAVALVATVWRAIRDTRRERRLHPIGAGLLRVGTAAAVVYLAFLLLWGFNYRRLPMAERLEMASAESPDAKAVMTLGFESANRMNGLYAEAHRAGWTEDPRNDSALLDAFRQVQAHLSDAPPAVAGRLKRSLYGTYFRWTGVDGMVNPFALEVLANPDLLPFERSFVAAHEWAHLAGFADESEANFVGWLTCVRAGVAAQYSAWLYLYWQVSGEVDAAGRMELREALADGPQADVDAIIERLRRGQLALLRNASWAVYDHYLRANRVEEGIRSYGEVVTLLLRARFDPGWTPVRRRTTAPSR